MTLSTPVLFVIFPLIVAAVAIAFSNRTIFVTILTGVTALALALLAAFFPESMMIEIGPLAVAFEESLEVLGRSITLTINIMPVISLSFAAAGLWILLGNVTSIPKFFQPISLVISALLTAALGVEPFLYAALFIQTAVLASLPILSPEGKKPQPGVLRFLILETLSLPFLLLAGWLLSGVETLPVDSPLVGQSAIILGLGFALMLGAFPFHSWLPMISQHSHPTAVSFLLFLLPSTVILFSLNFLDRYTFLRTLQNLQGILSQLGAILIFIGGIWTAVQNNPKRVFGYTILVEAGYSLLALGLFSQGGLEWLLMLLPGRALGFWLWGFSMSLIEEYNGSMDLKALQGFARRYPFLSSGLLIAQLTIAGLPILAAFPIKFSILSAAIINRTSIGIWIYLGSFGLFFFTFRMMASFFRSTRAAEVQSWTITEKMREYMPIVFIILVLVILGLFPNLIENITSALTAFPQLQ